MTMFSELTACAQAHADRNKARAESLRQVAQQLEERAEAMRLNGASRGRVDFELEYATTQANAADMFERRAERWSRVAQLTGSLRGDRGVRRVP
jgi:hypothetical protein